MPGTLRLRATLALLALVVSANTGCHVINPNAPQVAAPARVADETPRELYKAALPEYRVEPPDILEIDAVRLLPLPNYTLHVQDIVMVDVFVSAETPIFNVEQQELVVGLDGSIDLGPTYGTIKIEGLTPQKAREKVRDTILSQMNTAQVSFRVAAIPTLQPVTGQHLVAPDGTISLGTYGNLSLVGMSLNEAKVAIERHLSQFLSDPEVAVSVWAYNSKKYYVITEGAGLGDTVTQFPITGNETVLDAIANVNGLEQVSSKNIWIARPTRDPCKMQILPVDWKAITAQGSTATNYQVMPGDRVFIAEDGMIAFDNGFAKLLAPFERVMGFALLGVNTVTRFSGSVLKGGGNPYNSRNF